MRLTKPNWDFPVQVNQAGIGIINLFTSDLYEFLDSSLSKLFGVNWATTFPQDFPNKPTSNFRDPSILLKDLGRKITPSLRLPINAKVAPDQYTRFYNLLDDIHGERHLWVHQEIEPTKKNLFALVKLIHAVATILNLPVKSECEMLVNEVNEINEDKLESTESNSEVESELVTAIITLTKDESVNVGAPLSGPYMDYSYTLHLNGSIRDREAGILLSDVNNNAEAIGALLIARKPNGGRIRLLPNGVLAAYFDDHWGFLAQIEEINWFPGHLGNTSQVP